MLMVELHVFLMNKLSDKSANINNCQSEDDNTEFVVGNNEMKLSAKMNTITLSGSCRWYCVLQPGIVSERLP